MKRGCQGAPSMSLRTRQPLPWPHPVLISPPGDSQEEKTPTVPRQGRGRPVPASVVLLCFIKENPAPLVSSGSGTAPVNSLPPPLKKKKQTKTGRAEGHGVLCPPPLQPCPEDPGRRSGRVGPRRPRFGAVKMALLSPRLR